MQCRICLEEGGDLLVPCRCRGTASYIHRTCLDQYIQYYPDRICRVCHTRFVYYESPREVFLCWFLMVCLTLPLFFSNARIFVKLLLFASTAVLSLFFLRRNLFDTTPVVFTSILAILFLPGGNPAVVYIWMFILGVLAFVYTLSQYLSAIALLSIVVTSMVAAYVGFFVVMSYHVLDSAAFTVFISVLYLAWYAWLHSRDMRLRVT